LACFLGWCGGPGKGSCIGVGEVKFTGQILPTAKKSNLSALDIEKRWNQTANCFMGMADGTGALTVVLFIG